MDILSSDNSSKDIKEEHVYCEWSVTLMYETWIRAYFSIQRIRMLTHESTISLYFVRFYLENKLHFRKTMNKILSNWLLLDLKSQNSQFHFCLLSDVLFFCILQRNHICSPSSYVRCWSRFGRLQFFFGFFFSAMNILTEIWKLLLVRWKMQKLALHGGQFEEEKKTYVICDCCVFDALNRRSNKYRQNVV